MLKPWTVIFDTDTFSGNTYDTNWTIDFASLKSGATNYVSVRVIDVASTSYTYSDDLFYVLKDTVSPSATDNQQDTVSWQNDNSYTYDVDFQDSGGSKLDYFQVKACSAPAQGGLTADWTTVETGLDSNSYTADWTLPGSFWEALKDEATNYISVRAADAAGNISAVSEDVFFVRKDTSSPVVADNQTGDNTWRKTGGTLYDVDFYDYGANLSDLKYSIYSSADMTGVRLATWTVIAASVNAPEYTSDWSVDFSSLSTGTNYISVKSRDNAGNQIITKDPGSNRQPAGRRYLAENRRYDV
jgi:hypothetical protein